MNQIMENLKLLHRFFQDRDDLWCHIRAMHQYLDNVLQFLEQILLLMHITRNQPTRASEILQIRHHNIMQGEYRNLFIENEFISIVIIYHKNYSMKGMIKIIHRFLTCEMNELMMYYLWLILSFRWQLDILTLGKINPHSSLL